MQKSYSSKILILAVIVGLLPFLIIFFGYTNPTLWIMSGLVALCLILLISLITWQNQRLGKELQLALERHEFVVHYMPVLDLSSNRCVSAEALVRWQHPQHGLLGPNAFIPHAEHTGLIEPLTEEVIHLVIHDMAEFLCEHRDFIIAINLSAAHFDNHRIIEISDKLCQQNHVNSNQLMYEITERTLVDVTQQIPNQVIHSIRERQSGLALDDFGAGHSNLHYAQLFPLSYVKLDKELIANITHSTSIEKLTGSLIASAKTLDIHIIAEGVETAEQAQYLRDQGVNLVQGWYFSKAIPKDEFLLFISDKI